MQEQWVSLYGLLFVLYLHNKNFLISLLCRLYSHLSLVTWKVFTLNFFTFVKKNRLPSFSVCSKPYVEYYPSLLEDPQ